MEDVSYVRTLGGESQATLNAAEASYFQKRNDVEMLKIEAKFIEAARETRVRAERGSMNLDTRQGKLIGNVVGRTSDGMVLRTLQLGFDTAAKRLFTDQAVLLEGVSFTLQGVGADVDLVTQKAGLRQQVEGTTWSATR
jgi:LPS export ABC transporter protein LptC